MTNWLRPWRWVSLFRSFWLESITPAGNVVILATIASLNAVWGYPLVGLLAALIVLLGVSATANWVFRPRLHAVMRAPEMVSARALLDLTILLENRSSLPGFDLSFSLVDMPIGWTVVNEPVMLAKLESNVTVTVRYTIEVGGRGDFQWPNFKCVSTFPFSLFRSKQIFDFASANRMHGNRTLVTPNLLESTITGFVQSLIKRGQQSAGMRSGDSLEYLGSREYHHGDSVRRWDFAAWARLGYPIVRQFDQNSTGNLTIVVDTFLEAAYIDKSKAEFENRLSLAASIIHHLKYSNSTIHLILPAIAENDVDRLDSVLSDNSILSLFAESAMQSKLLRPLAIVKGVLSTEKRGRLRSQYSWSSVSSLVDADNPLVCIMASVALPATKERTQSYDFERDAFLSRVACFAASLVVFSDDNVASFSSHSSRL